MVHVGSPHATFSKSTHTDLLVLGHGWHGDFLEPVAQDNNLSLVFTTRDGRDGSIAWTLPDEPSKVDVEPLPLAATVIISFPITSEELTEALIVAYNRKLEANAKKPPQWIKLSSTSPYKQIPSNRHTPLDKALEGSDRHLGERAIARHKGIILHLAGLWGNQRQPRNWIPRFPDEVKIKPKLLPGNRSLHLIHGHDVARAIVGMHQYFPINDPNRRWIVTDNSTYHWIKLFWTWGAQTQRDIMEKLVKHDEDVRKAFGGRTLLEEMELGVERYKRLDASEFWNWVHLKPERLLRIE
ncbi:hypothetical protein BZG36_01219 [Bifiguratus adelaidae]|uniref:Uncharacterized protein n=1 Tax=Bifiguratus adelaidae TaxID=1938954 RepID=A0A261Y5R5_9FUNG|nr:hypothetical protein BZG36_01219 [Bifiguratus adelaidae]